MTEEQIYQDLASIFEDVFLREDIPINPALSAKDVPGWDSVKLIEIIMAIEAKYKFKFRTKEMDNLSCVGDLVAVILQKAP